VDSPPRKSLETIIEGRTSPELYSDTVDPRRLCSSIPVVGTLRLCAWLFGFRVLVCHHQFQPGEAWPGGALLSSFDEPKMTHSFMTRRFLNLNLDAAQRNLLGVAVSASNYRRIND
jgi:hypothetical protein